MVSFFALLCFALLCFALLRFASLCFALLCFGARVVVHPFYSELKRGFSDVRLYR